MCDMPEGTLYISPNRGTYQFLHAIDGRRRCISRDTDLIYQLARKRYLKAVIEERKAVIDKLIYSLRTSGKTRLPATKRYRASQVLARFAQAGLDILRISRSPEQYRWMTEPYRKNPYQMSSPSYESSRGVVLRSKSEQKIAMELEQYGIPYRYEPEVKLNVSWMEGLGSLISGRYKYYYPDFVIMDAFGDFFIWEHLGRVDSEEYRLHTMEKVSAYRQCGLVDDLHLLLTYEKDLEKPESLQKLLVDRVLPYV